MVDSGVYSKRLLLWTSGQLFIRLVNPVFTLSVSISQSYSQATPPPPTFTIAEFGASVQPQAFQVITHKNEFFKSRFKSHNYLKRLELFIRNKTVLQNVMSITRFSPTKTMKISVVAWCSLLIVNKNAPWHAEHDMWILESNAILWLTSLA